METKTFKIIVYILAAILLVGTVLYLEVNDKYHVLLDKVTDNRVKGKFIGQLPTYSKSFPNDNLDHSMIKSIFLNPMLIDENRFIICEDSKLQKEIWSQTFDGRIICQYIDYTFDNSLSTYIFLLTSDKISNKLTCFRHSNKSNDKSQTMLVSQVFSVETPAIKIVACCENSAIKTPIVCVQNKAMNNIDVIAFDGSTVKSNQMDVAVYFAENCRTIYSSDVYPSDNDNPHSSYTVGFDGSKVFFFDLAKSIDFKPVKVLKTGQTTDIWNCKIESVDDVFEYQASRNQRDFVHRQEGLTLNTGKSLFSITDKALIEIMDLDSVDSICGVKIITSGNKLYDWQLDYNPLEFNGKLSVFGIRFFVISQHYSNKSNVMFLDFANKYSKHKKLVFNESRFVPGKIQSMTCGYDDQLKENIYYFYTENQVYSINWGSILFPSGSMLLW